jgi:hypothetical protein
MWSSKLEEWAVVSKQAVSLKSWEFDLWKNNVWFEDFTYVYCSTVILGVCDLVRLL